MAYPRLENSMLLTCQEQLARLRRQLWWQILTNLLPRPNAWSWLLQPVPCHQMSRMQCVSALHSFAHFLGTLDRPQALIWDLLRCPQLSTHIPHIFRRCGQGGVVAWRRVSPFLVLAPLLVKSLLPYCPRGWTQRACVILEFCPTPRLTLALWILSHLTSTM
uniref:Uncharacterized protein n=1 Tax=Sapovirus Hu/Chiba/000671/1999/JP TaxID=168047 RepID=Q0E7T9_9CALI|nr:hypothetical protein [Sapovirus Hu/Chiba/000671/1999/JP]